jgi:hypothetical protein
VADWTHTLGSPACTTAAAEKMVIAAAANAKAFEIFINSFLIGLRGFHCKSKINPTGTTAFFPAFGSGAIVVINKSTLNIKTIRGITKSTDSGKCEISGYSHQLKYILLFANPHIANSR